MLLLLGGIGPEQVFQAVLVLLASAVAAGSLGGLVALWREKTYQALALSVLFLVLYICLTFLITRAFRFLERYLNKDRLEPIQISTPLPIEVS